MKVVHLSTSDYAGGAGRATYRLHSALLKEGVDSCMLVSKKSGRIADTHVVTPKRTMAGVVISRFPEIDSLLLGQLYPNKEQATFSLNFLPRLNVKKEKLIQESDIVGVYWIGYNYITPYQFKHFNRPIVWRLSDTWPFTGGCHYPGSCTRYQEKCGKCPQLGSKSDFDASRWTWKRKKEAWKNLNLTIVAPSTWIADCARKSSLFKDKPVRVIHTGVDHTIFKPHDQKTARGILGISKSKKCILFGGVNSTTDPRKGFAYLSKALEILKSQDLFSDVQILTFGGPAATHLTEMGIENTNLGILNDDSTLALAYSAADVFVAPSIRENLPNTVLESFACGRPAVAFRVGGIPNVINHMENGYLAKPLSSQDLACGIASVLEDEQRLSGLKQAARKTVLERFTLEQQARQYITLYQEILEQV